MSEKATQPPPPKSRWLRERPAISHKPPVKLAARKRFTVSDIALPAFSLATGAMVGLSAPHLIDPQGLSGWFKVALLTGSATLVSYVVNRHAILTGADLTARGYLSAGLVSVGSIVLVGAGLFASTFSGLTIERVNDLRLQEHGQALRAHIEAVSAQASKAAQVMPAIGAAVADIQQHLVCEEQESCLSGRKAGGRGTVTRAIEPIARRSSEISAQLSKGDTERSDRLADLNRLVGEYQTILSNYELGSAEKRRSLMRVDARIKQDSNDFLNAMPVNLLGSYAAELESGFTIAGRPEATHNINALLHRHGRAIESALEGIDQTAPRPPAFPDEAGVSSTFLYMGHFLPIAALTLVIELVMPLTLWIYALLTHLWSIYRQEPPTHIEVSANSEGGLNGI